VKPRGTSLWDLRCALRGGREMRGEGLGEIEVGLRGGSESREKKVGWEREREWAGTGCAETGLGGGI
jgi:hypothetical protein